MITDKLYILQAQADIIRFCGNVKIEDVSTGIYDFRVSDASQGLLFGVFVVSSKYESTAMYQDFQNKLRTVDLRSDEYKLPIIIMSVNANAMKSSFGIAVSWHRERPTIYSKISMRESNEMNWGHALDHIVSMNDAIAVLSRYGLNVKKSISIETEGYDGIPCYGEVIYLRNFTDNYKMKQNIIKDEKEKFERLLYGIPEDEYPSDIIDSIIEKSIASHWTVHPCRGSNVKSDSFLFTTDLKEIQHYRNSCRVDVNIVIQPNLTEIPQNILPLLNNLNLVTIPVSIYCDSEREKHAFNELLLHYIEPLDADWSRRMSTYMELKNTIHQLDEFFE